MTKPYHLRIAPSAYRQIKTLAAKQQQNILKLAEALTVNPRPPDVKKIEGMMGLYCEILSPHRVVYKIEDQEVLILLIK